MKLDIDETADEGQIDKQVSAALADGAKSVKAILEKVPDTRKLVLLAVFRCLGAHKMVFTKGKSEGNKEHDYRTQLEAAKLLMAYSDGLPLQTIAAITDPSKTKDSFADIRESAKRSPAVRDGLRQMLDELEKPALPG